MSRIYEDDDGVAWIDVTDDPTVELWYAQREGQRETRTFEPKEGRIKLGRNLPHPIRATLTPADIERRTPLQLVYPEATPPPDPEPTPGAFGAKLDAWCDKPKPATGAIHVVRTVNELLNALSSMNAGDVVEGAKGVRLDTGSSKVRAVVGKPGEVRKLTTRGVEWVTDASDLTIRRLEADMAHLAPNPMWHRSGARVRCEDLILTGAERQGSSFDADHVHYERVITFANGNVGDGNKTHGIYVAHSLRWAIVDQLSYDNVAYQLQSFPEAREGLVVNGTYDGGIIRGGIVCGCNGSGDATPTRDVRHIGVIVTNTASGIYAFNHNAVTVAGPMSVEDSLWFGAKGGVEPPEGGDGFIVKRLTNADPKYVNRAAKDYRLQPGSPAVNLIAEENHPWVRRATAGYGGPTIAEMRARIAA